MFTRLIGLGLAALALAAPAGVPAKISAKVQSEIARALQTAAVQKGLATRRLQPVGDTPQAFKTFFAGELKRFAEIVKATGYKPE